MFKTIKAKVTAYKWIIILSLFSGLTIFSLVQYYQANTLRDRTATLEEKNTELTTRLTTIHTEFNEYKGKVDNAMDALDDLRTVFSGISDDTATLEQRLKLLDSLGKNPQPGSNGVNASQMEQDANKLMEDIFSRFEDASKKKETTP